MNIFERLYIAVFKQEAKRKLFTKALSKLNQPNLYPATEANAVHFKHFGLVGDIIYAIPAMIALAGEKKNSPSPPDQPKVTLQKKHEACQQRQNIDRKKCGNACPPFTGSTGICSM